MRQRLKNSSFTDSYKEFKYAFIINRVPCPFCLANAFF